MLHKINWLITNVEYHVAARTTLKDMHYEDIKWKNIIKEAGGFHKKVDVEVLWNDNDSQ